MERAAGEPGLGVRRPGVDHRQPARPHLAPERAEAGRDPRLRGRVRDDAGRRKIGHDAAHVEHEAAGREDGNSGSRQRERAYEVDRNDLVEDVEGDLLERAEGDHAGAADDAVQPAERGGRSSDEPRRRGAVRQVERKRGRLDAEVVQAACAPSRDGDAGAPAGEGGCERPADTARGTDDQDAGVAQRPALGGRSAQRDAFPAPDARARITTGSPGTSRGSARRSSPRRLAPGSARSSGACRRRERRRCGSSFASERRAPRVRG